MIIESLKQKLFSWLNCALRDANSDTIWYLMVLGQCKVIWVDTWWYLVSMRRYWLILGGTGSVWGSTGWYLATLGQYGAVLVSTWWYWVSIGRYWLVHGGTGSLRDNAGRD